MSKSIKTAIRLAREDRRVDDKSAEILEKILGDMPPELADNMEMRAKGIDDPMGKHLEAEFESTYDTGLSLTETFDFCVKMSRVIIEDGGSIPPALVSIPTFRKAVSAVDKMIDAEALLANPTLPPEDRVQQEVLYKQLGVEIAKLREFMQQIDEADEEDVEEDDPEYTMFVDSLEEAVQAGNISTKKLESNLMHAFLLRQFTDGVSPPFVGKLRETLMGPLMRAELEDVEERLDELEYEEGDTAAGERLVLEEKLADLERRARGN